MRTGRTWVRSAASLSVVAVVLAACGSPGSPAAPSRPTPKVATPAPICPLTAQPAVSGSVPLRPALAVKVDNYPQARPQSGLDKADIIFEEPVEGGITRYVAVFQCQDATEVGPIRSARNIDVGILGEFGRPLLVNVGGIDPVLSNIAASPILENDLRIHSSVVQHAPGRFAPYDTYAATSTLWGLQPGQKTTPASVFSFSQAVPTGTPAASVAIPFSSTSNVVWTYDRATRQYLRSFGPHPDLLTDGAQNSASTVVVQVVQLSYGPWYENDVGGLEVQANLYQAASGGAEVFRDGVEVTGTWHRSALGQPTQFISSTGTPIQIQPGRTWVELVPSTIGVTATP